MTTSTIYPPPPPPLSTPKPLYDFETVEIPSKYAKAIVAIITAGLVALIVAMEDDEVSSVELINVALALVTAFAVYQVTERNWVKAIVAFIGVGLQALLPFAINGEVTDRQWLIVLVAAIGALGVGVVPNVRQRLAAVVNNNTTVNGGDLPPARPTQLPAEPVPQPTSSTSTMDPVPTYEDPNERPNPT
jgi:hypothetical protein